MASPHQPTVLIVEDEVDLAELYAAWLQDAYQVRIATTGEEALELVDSTVDVALVDRRLPGMPGDAVVAEFRRRNYAIQIAMVSAVEPAFDIMELGFDDYLQKPVTREDINSLVEMLLNRSTYDRESQELFQLLSKRAVLEAQFSEATLDNHDEYQRLDARITDLEGRLDSATDELTDDDFTALFRRLDTPQ